MSFNYFCCELVIIVLQENVCFYIASCKIHILYFFNIFYKSHMKSFDNFKWLKSLYDVRKGKLPYDDSSGNTYS